MGIEHTKVEGQFDATMVGGEGVSPHWYVGINSSQIDGIEPTGSIILDATLHQFTTDNFESGTVSAYVEGVDNHSLIITQDDELYEAYRKSP